MPFRRQEAFEPALVQTLKSLACQQQVFRVPLTGFDCFPPRVLFVKVGNQEAITELYNRLQKVLKEDLGFRQHEQGFRFHPHMTIATRDLSEGSFLRAWPEFAKRTFDDGFVVKSLFLLKHNEKKWQLFREFPFQGVPAA